MIVSVCVIAYNEEEFLGGVLDDIKKQTFPHEQMEIVLIDSMSGDRTRQIMEQFQRENRDFKDIIVCENPKKKLAAGWNVALSRYTGDVILKIDAHASVPEDFVEKNVSVLESGEYVSGGIRPNIILGSTPWKETLLMAEQSMFGSSVASFRRSDKKAYVKSLFHGAYRREVFEKAGGFNESLGRTEDNEMNYRIRKAGYRLCYSPDIISYQYARSSLKAMVRQKYGNGYWVALTLGVCPGCLSVYHFVPAAFVFGILVTTAMSLCGIWQLAAVMWALYWLCAVIMALLAVRGEKKHIQQLLLPFLFFILHVSYGVGSVVGFLKYPFWKKEGKGE